MNSFMQPENFDKFSQTLNYPVHVQPLVEGLVVQWRNQKLVTKEKTSVSLPWLVASLIKSQCPYPLEGVLFLKDFPDFKLTGDFLETLPRTIATQAWFAVFDYVGSLGFYQRRERMRIEFRDKPFGRNVWLVPSVQITDQSCLYKEHVKQCQQGFKGILVRDSLASHLPGKTSATLILEKYYDERVELVGVVKWEDRYELVCHTETGELLKIIDISPADLQKAQLLLENRGSFTIQVHIEYYAKNEDIPVRPRIKQYVINH